jgi:hypothetical protein
MILMCALLAPAASKKPAATAQGANEKVRIAATLLLDPDAIRQELGSDLGGFFVVARVEIAPQGGKPLAVGPDDFLLRSYKDGQKSEAFLPSQIAGKATLVISSVGAGGGGVASEPRGPTWGGIGGRPGRIGSEPGGVGNTGQQTAARATVETNDKGKEDPLLKTLSEKILPQKETNGPASGLLYFSLEGKHKPKDLVLQYNGPAGKLSLKFE